MPIAITRKERASYVLREERGEDGTPKPGAALFYYRPLSQLEKRAIKNRFFKTNISNGDCFIEAQGDFYFTIMKNLCGWENFKDGEGNAVPFRVLGKNSPDNPNLNHLSDEHQAEIAMAILNDSEVTADDLGN